MNILIQKFFSYYSKNRMTYLQKVSRVLFYPRSVEYYTLGICLLTDFLIINTVSFRLSEIFILFSYSCFCHSYYSLYFICVHPTVIITPKGFLCFCIYLKIHILLSCKSLCINYLWRTAHHNYFLTRISTVFYQN